MMSDKLKNIVIYGAGGFGREVAWLIEEINKKKKEYEIVGFIDDDPSTKGNVINEYPALGGVEFLEGKSGISVALSMADPIKRLEVAENLKSLQLNFPNLIHPSVLIGKRVDFGIGNIICAGVIITVNIRVGSFCHLNLKTTLGHNCILENFVTTACSVDFAGNSHICNSTYFGNHATVLPYVRVAPFSVVGAGAVANRDIPEGVISVGVPAKVIKANPAYIKFESQVKDASLSKESNIIKTQNDQLTQSRFENWEYPDIKEGIANKYSRMVQYVDNFILGFKTDIGAFTFINAKHGVVIEDYAQLGSHCSVYSDSTVDNKKGKVHIKTGSKIGSHTVIMPGVTIGENSVVGAHSFVTDSIPDGATAVGVPAKVVKSHKSGG
jgi:sugar O-acyltransferase (sialic acid O-acetyltransferase NeuD family)